MNALGSNLMGRPIILALAVTILSIPLARAAETTGKTKSLVAVLQSDASLFEKARACQQLGELGTPEAVPALAALLADPQLSAYARSGLENIPAPSATATLRGAAQKLNGPLLAGVVNSLGVLRDTQSTELLGRLAFQPSSGVAKEALHALGNIATPDSIRFLKKALTSAKVSRDDAAAACLLAADRQQASGNLSQAAALYDMLRKANVPAPYLAGATRGAILARKTGRASFLMTQLRSKDSVIRNAALLTIREVPDESLADVLNTELGSASPELQQQLLLALADCHNAQSVPVAQALLSHSNPEIRKTALAVLGQLGPPAAPALLMALHSARTAEEKTIVLTGLRAMSGSAVDDVLLHALTSTLDRELQVELIRLLDNRGATKATPQILKLAEASDTNVRIAAFSALRSLAGSNEVSALVALTRSSPGQEVRNAAENALGNVCSHSDDSASELVLKELNQSKAAEERNSWLRVLGQVGYAGALPAIEAAVADSASQVAYTAIEQLGHWPNPAPMKTLLKALDSAADDACRRRALVSVLDLATTAADDALAPESTIVSWLQRVTPVALSLEDKRRLIGLLGRLKTTQSLGLTLPYLEDPTVSTEAASAVVQIAPALLQADNAQTLKPALEKIAATVKNQELRDRAQRLASTISSSNGPVSLFDGHSLAGWEGDTNVWRVSEGLIVGGSLNGNVRNEFLATLRSYTNFLLRLEYKLVGTEGFVNSGVQFRSVRLTNPPNEMKGYQADIGAGYSGCLYDESRRNSVLARASQETIQRLEKTNDWNEYQIRAEGTHIQIWLNGQKTIDYAEPDAVIPQTGLIGLQIHGGNKAEVSFRNITLRELP